MLCHGLRARLDFQNNGSVSVEDVGHAECDGTCPRQRYGKRRARCTRFYWFLKRSRETPCKEFAIGIQMFSGGAKSIDVARRAFCSPCAEETSDEGSLTWPDSIAI